MSLSLDNYYKNIIVYDLISKLNIQNIYKIPKITKINLSIIFKKKKKKDLLTVFLFLNLLTNQIPFFIQSKKNSIILKIKKNAIIGFKIILRKKYIYIFLEKILFFIFPNIKKKSYYFLKNNKNFNFKINNLLNFFEFNKEFIKFKEIFYLSLFVSVNSHNCNYKSDLYTLLNFFFFSNIKN